MWHGILLRLMPTFALISGIAQLSPAERKLVGTWEVVEAIEGDEVQQYMVKAKLTFLGRGEFACNEGVIVTPEGDKGRLVWWLKPKQGDNAIWVGFALLAKPGIYKLEGETLTMCFSGRGEQNPPKEFSGSKKSECSLWRLKLVK